MFITKILSDIYNHLYNFCHSFSMIKNVNKSLMSKTL